MNTPLCKVPECLGGQSLPRVTSIAMDEPNLLRCRRREEEAITSPLEVLPKVMSKIKTGREIQRQISVESQRLPLTVLGHRSMLGHPPNIRHAVHRSGNWQPAALQQPACSPQFHRGN